MKKKASMHKRRYIADPSSIYRVMNRIQNFTIEEQNKLANPLRAAFERMRNGVGSAEDWNSLKDAANISMVRSESVDPFCVETCTRAQEALLRAKDRYLRLKSWGFDGPGLLDIMAMLDLHEEFVRLSTPLQMHDAIREVFRRLEKGQVNRIEGAVN